MGKKVEEVKKVEEGKKVEESEQDRTVFISGLPYASSEEEIKAIFIDCGLIEYIK